PHRLSVRTGDSQSSKRGSIPRGGATFRLAGRERYGIFHPMLRRTFLQAAAVGTAVAGSRSRLLAAASSPPKLAVGMDNYSVRSLGWKAPQLIDFAASIKCDALFISDLESYESLD